MNSCPECHEFLKSSAKRCQCGWIRKASLDKPVYRCQVIQCGQPCNATQDLFNVSSREKPVFWCLKHFNERRTKSSLEQKIDATAKVISDSAKLANMTNQEYCKDLYPDMFRLIEKQAKPQSAVAEKNTRAVKEILIKQNSLYGNLN